jgi:hypothetical protein
MFNVNLDERGKEIGTNVAVIFLIFLSGLIFSVSYFIMDTVQTSFESVDCDIPGNTLVSSCQEWFNLALYPILNLKSVLIYAQYFAIFGLVFGLFYLGFRTKKHPALLIVHIVVSTIMGYIALTVGNLYRMMLSNDALYTMLIPFGVYNKIMLYFPQFIFFVIFLSGIIGFFGVFKSVGQFNEGNEDLG